MLKLSTVSEPPHRRWTRRPTIHTVACDVVVWALWFALVAAIILSMCALLWVAT